MWAGRSVSAKPYNPMLDTDNPENRLGRVLVALECFVVGLVFTPDDRRIRAHGFAPTRAESA